MKKKKIISVIAIVVLIVVLLIASAMYIINDIKKTLIKQAFGDFNQTESIDVKEYYEKNSKIIDSFNAKTSKNVQTEKEAIDVFAARGFGKEPVYYDYSIDGEYVGETKAKISREKHPMYQTQYVTPGGNVWTIVMINGSILANPVNYNMESEEDAQLIISESEIITGYDNANNIFFETIPKKSELIVKIVDTINSETINSLTTKKNQQVVINITPDKTGT